MRCRAGAEGVNLQAGTGFFFFFCIKGYHEGMGEVGFELKGRKRFQKKWKSGCPTTLKQGGDSKSSGKLEVALLLLFVLFMLDLT